VDCPDGFSRVAGVDGCYKKLTYKMTWYAASEMCKAYNKNARLLIIESQQEQTAVSAWLDANAGIAYYVCLYSNVADSQ